MKFTFGDRAGEDMLVLKSSNALGFLPCISKLEVMVPTDLEKSMTGHPRVPDGDQLKSPISRGQYMVPITSTKLKELSTMAANIFRTGTKLKSIGSLSYNGGFSSFSLKVLADDGVCVFTLKSGKRQQNFDRAVEQQIDVFKGNTDDKVCTVRSAK